MPTREHKIHREQDMQQPVDSSTPTQVTVKFSPKSVAALNHASSTAGINMTDTINRAVQLYDFVVEQMKSDGVLIIENNGRQEKIKLV